MSRTNCKNCGAPIELEVSKCAYCGTSYFDFSDIDLQAPVFLRLKYNNNIIVMKARVTRCAVCIEPETVTYGDDYGLVLGQIVQSLTPTVDLSFVGVGG